MKIENFAEKRKRDAWKKSNCAFITSYERDIESSLDFAEARMYGYSLGRFTSPDPLAASANPIRPQSWNRYSYSYNNPYKFTDPTGMIPDWVQQGDETFYDSRVVDQQSATELYGEGATYRANGYEFVSYAGNNIALGDSGSFTRNGVALTSPDRAVDATGVSEQLPVSVGLLRPAASLSATSMTEAGAVTAGGASGPFVLVTLLGVGTLDLIANPRPGSLMNPLPPQRTWDGLPIQSSTSGLPPSRQLPPAPGLQLVPAHASPASLPAVPAPSGAGGPPGRNDRCNAALLTCLSRVDNNRMHLCSKAWATCTNQPDITVKFPDHTIVRP